MSIVSLSKTAYLTQVEAIQHRAKMIKSFYSSNDPVPSKFIEQIEKIIGKANDMVDNEDPESIPHLTATLEYIHTIIPDTALVLDRNTYYQESHRLNERLARLLVDHGDVVTMEKRLWAHVEDTKTFVSDLLPPLGEDVIIMTKLDRIVLSRTLLLADSSISLVEKYMLDLKRYLKGDLT